MPEYYDRCHGYPRCSTSSEGKSITDRWMCKIEDSTDEGLESMLEYTATAIGDACSFDETMQLTDVQAYPGTGSESLIMFYDLTYNLAGLKPIVDSTVPVLEMNGGSAGRQIEMAKQYKTWWNYCLIIKDDLEDDPDSLHDDIIDMTNDPTLNRTTEIPSHLIGKILWIKGDTPTGWSIFDKEFDRIKLGLQEYQISAFTMTEYYLFSDYTTAASKANMQNFILTPELFAMNEELASYFDGEFLVTNVTINSEGKAFAVRMQYQFSPWVTDDDGEYVYSATDDTVKLGGFDHDIYRTPAG